MPPRAAAPSQRVHWSTLLLAACPLCLAAFAFTLQLRSAAELHDSEALWRRGGAGSTASLSARHDARLRRADPAGGWGGAGGVHAAAGLEAMPPQPQPSHTGEVPGLELHSALALSYQTAAQRGNKTEVLISTTTGDNLARIRQWYRYHRAIGVEHFYLFVEGHAAEPECVDALRLLPGVRVFLRTEALEAAHNASRIWNEKWLASFFDKPCNYELFVRQNLNLETAIAAALAEGGIGWIAHIDTDELLYPGGTADFSLRTLLGAVPANVDALVFPNYESGAERDDVVDPFTQVTLFKRNFDHVVREVYFARYKEMTRGNPNYFLTYGNGKAAARLVPGLRPNGAHRFHNYVRAPIEGKATEGAVLHFTYARFEDVRARRGRCNCGHSDEEVAQCFILEFDRWVFRKASAELDDDKLRDWYREHVVWTDAAFVRSQLANGLFARIHAPSLLVKVLDAAAAAEEADAARAHETRLGTQ